QGLGMTILQTASNPYITILGPIESAAKRISIMGIANKSAGALGSFIFGALLLSGIDEIQEKLALVDDAQKNALLQEMANSVVLPYIVMAVVLFVLALLINKAPLPNVEDNEIEETESESGVVRTRKNSNCKFSHLWLGVLTLFL